MMKTRFILSLMVLAVSLQAQNLDFENWTTTSAPQDSLISWSSTNHAVRNVTTMITCMTQSTDFHGGSYAADLQTAPFGFVGTPVVGIMVSGEAELDFDAVSTSHVSGGGTPYNLRPTSLSGYYKINGPYNGIVRTYLSKYNSATQSRDTIAHGGFILSANTSTYTNFNIPLMYQSSQNPDTATIIIFASDPAAVPTSNAVFSTLTIDDITFNSPPDVYDGSVSAVASPSAGSTINTADTVSCWIKNEGNKEIHTFDVAYIVNGQIKNKVLESFTDTIQAGDSSLFIFQQLWTPQTAGSYDICVMLENLTNDINQKNDTACVSLSSNLGSSELEKAKLSLYPNPAQTVIKLKTNNSDLSNYSIYNVVGQKIKSGKLNHNSINIEDLESGTYLLNIESKESELIQSLKFIKE